MKLELAQYRETGGISRSSGSDLDKAHAGAAESRPAAG